MLSRKAEFGADWDRSLISLLPPDETPDLRGGLGDGNYVRAEDSFVVTRQLRFTEARPGKSVPTVLLDAVHAAAPRGEPGTREIVTGVAEQTGCHCIVGLLSRTVSDLNRPLSQANREAIVEYREQIGWLLDQSSLLEDGELVRPFLPESGGSGPVRLVNTSRRRHPPADKGGTGDTKTRCAQTGRRLHTRIGRSSLSLAWAGPSTGLVQNGVPYGDPNGIRTRVATLKGWCPRPLDDGVA